MSMNVQQRGTGFQLRVKDRLLPKAFFHTFGSRIEAESYGNLLKAQLARGVVPREVLDKLSPPKRGSDPMVTDLLTSYKTRNASISRTDTKDSGYVAREFAAERMSDIDYDFVEAFARRLRMRPMTPSTIRARIGLLGRVWDWHLGRSGSKGISNPWRLLPAGYSVANEKEQEEIVRSGKTIKRDQHRDRRLEQGEEDRIERVLDGEKLREDRERGLTANPELKVLFRCLLHTGARMREIYMLRRNQVDIASAYVTLAGTKGHRGALKPRKVPLRKALIATLSSWLAHLPAKEDRLFPNLWSGTEDKDELEGVSNRLSQQLSAVYDHAICPGLRTHDIRHEATCRWVTLQTPDGRYALSEQVVVKLMGWSSPAMIRRYLSLRGEDLAAMVSDL